MIKYIEGDIFSSPAQVIVNTVNTIGVMGKGLALDYKKRYPQMFEYYKKICDKQKLVIGKLILWYSPDHWLLLFPTKEHWKNPSKMEYIEKGLKTFVKKYADYNITSIAFPLLGCGNGNLNWDEVRPMMEKYLKELPIDIYIYQGINDNLKNEYKKKAAKGDWTLEKSIDLSFESIKDDICLHTYINPIEVEYNNIFWNASWRKGEKLTFDSKKERIEITEDIVRGIWDDVFDRRVFASDGSKEKDLLCSLLATIGYIQKIRLQDEETKKMIPGYQIEMGKARLYWLKVNN